MLIFPIDELMDEEACYRYLLKVLYPEGLHCPKGHRLPPEQAPHDRHRAPIYDYRCRECGAVYNIFTNTVWSKTHYSCSKIILIMRGIGQGIPTKHLAEELGIDRSNLLYHRHEIQGLIEKKIPSLCISRPGDGSRRDVSKRRRKGAKTPRSA